MVPTGNAPRRSGLLSSIVLAGCLFGTSSLAGPDRVSILTGSHHIGAAVSFEEVNPGVFITWEDRAAGLDYSLGAFRNSYGRGSVAALAALPVVSWRSGEVALFGGAALYPRDGRTFRAHLGDVVPVGGVQIRQGNSFVQIMPGDGRVADAVVSFGFTAILGGGK